MDSYKIAICGTPMVGKRTIIVEIGRYTGFKHTSMYSAEEANLFLDVTRHTKKLHFVAGCGVYLHPEKMVPHVLKDASAVIYVLSPAFPEKGRPHLNDDEHRYYIDMYLHYARELGVRWDHVPWLVVLNKTDLASHLPSEASRFPENILQGYVRCIASKGVGVPEVWQRLLELLHLPPK